MKQYMLYSTLLMACSFLALPVAAQDNTENGDKAASVNVPRRAMAGKAKYKMTDIKGMVTDAATGQPLAGIQVETLGDNRFTAMTDDGGRFTISVPVFASALYFHSPEYLALQVGISHGREVKVKMLADRFATLYSRRGDVSAAKSTTIHSAMTLSAEDDVATTLGADVRTITRSGAPGAGAAMFIRGLNSLNANAQPLIVVDGLIQDMQLSRTSLHQGDPNNMMLNINPSDIEKVTVLKNGTALYGARGANGVILIETRRGKSFATRIEANVGMSVVMKPQLPDMMKASDYRRYATEMLGSYPGTNAVIDKLNFLNDDPSGYYYKMYHNDTDWSREVYRTAIVQKYNINVEGGDNVGMYNLSLGYTDGQSTARDNGFSRLNVRFNSDINVTKHLTTKFDMDYVKLGRDVFDDGAPADFTKGPVSSPTFLALIKAPILSPYKYNSTSGEVSGSLSDADDFLKPLNQDLSLANPTAILANGNAVNKNRTENTSFHVMLAPRYEFSKALTLTETVSYQLNRNSQRYYRPVGGVPTFYVDGLGRVESMSMSLFSKEEILSSDTRLNFRRQLAAHYIDASAGFRYYSFDYDDNIPQGQYKTAGNDKTPNISANMDFREASGSDDSWKSLTWYADASYNYRNRYFLHATLAMDAGSRFGKNAPGLSMAGVKWGIFPGVEAGWIISNEDWFPRSAQINYLRLSAGYDISGNDDISNYASRTTFAAMKYLGRSVPAVMMYNIGNEKLKWEQTAKMNAGLETRLFDNRLALSADFYINNTSDLLTMKKFETPVAGLTGYWTNGGKLRNTGFELSVSGKPVVRHHFALEIGASAGHYKNEIKALPDNEYLYVDGSRNAQGYTSSVYGDANIATIVGHSAGVFYGYKTLGVLASDEEARQAGAGNYLYMTDKTGARHNFNAGDMHFADLNGDGEISEADKTIIGSPDPDIYGNFFVTASWKNISLSARFNYSLGNDLYNYQRSLLESGSNFYNQTTAMNNRWRNEGQQTDIPRATCGDPLGNSRFSDRWIEDGSYLRLSCLNVTYRVPVSTSWLQGLQVWAEAANLFTLTRYLGSDPEFSATNAVLGQGIDTGNVARSRSFTLGMKINL